MQVQSAAALACASSGGNLAAMGTLLARLGHTVHLCTSAGGTLRSLRHTFLTISSGSAGEPEGRAVAGTLVHLLDLTCTHRLAGRLPPLPHPN